MGIISKMHEHFCQHLGYMPFLLIRNNGGQFKLVRFREKQFTSIFLEYLGNVKMGCSQLFELVYAVI